MYQHILLAIEFNPQAGELLEKAYGLALSHQAKLSLLHAVDFIPLDSNDPSGLSLPTPLPEHLLQQAESELNNLVQTFPAPDSITVNTLVKLGGARHEIVATAREQQVDLILVGHHKPKGLGHLFGHTDESVVHHAPCDVLAVKLSGS